MYDFVTLENFIERMNQKDVKNNFSGSGLVELYSFLNCFDELLGDENAPNGNLPLCKSALTIQNTKT